MSLSRFLVRLLFPGYFWILRRLELLVYIFSEKLNNPALLGVVFPPDWPQKWELAGEGDQNDGDRQSSANPKQCPCGVDWAVNNASAFFNAKPNAIDIATLYATIQFPALGSCDG